MQLSAIAKRFGDKHVLRGVDLSIQPAQSVVIIGGSGTGKSVTIKCVLGLIRPDTGTVRLDGEDITHATGARRAAALDRMGML
ncbi:MAG: ATP-binding cassette domain-containing protein, partial [Pseudomonadota bacterium]